MSRTLRCLELQWYAEINKPKGSCDKHCINIFYINSNQLPPRPSNLDKLRPKPKTFFAHKESTLKRSGASTSPYSRSKQAPASASTSKIKAKPVTSATSQSQVGGAHTTTSPSPKRSKSGKKLRKKKKSKSASDVRSSSEEDGGKQYIKELVTINELLKSVTDPSNRVNPEVPLIEGFVRPFSAMELNQLLKRCDFIINLKLK